MRIKPFSLTQFGVMVAVVFGVMPASIFFLVRTDNGARSWFAEASNESIRRQLGFRTGFFAEAGMNCVDFRWGVTDVVAGGVFDQAGVRRGDVPITVMWRPSDGPPFESMIWDNGSNTARLLFYHVISNASPAAPVEFTVVPCSLEGKQRNEVKRHIRVALPAG